MRSFIAELRRRNVLRVAAFYSAGAWVLVQAATQILPFFDTPNWVVRWVVMAAVIGLPAVMLLSWYYELTPQGLKLESRLTREDSAAREQSRKLNGRTIAALALAVAAVAALSSHLLPHQAATPASGTAPSAASPVASAQPAAVNEKSIAVLPFENLSDDKSNAYFAIGIQDEILTRLARIGSLNVVSRTSTQHYASSPDNLPEIGRQLGVANILEGSVQKAGDAVHINVQLIRAASDHHVWAESYDRKLTDTFGVESEVAQAIANALNARLSGAERAAMDEKPTRNASAYDAYLRGLAFQVALNELNSNDKAAAQFKEAVRLDPSFALAWAHLATAQSMIYFNEDQSPALLAQMEQAAATAMKLQPELGEAWLAKGYYLYRGKSDYDGALMAFEQARQRLPNSSEVLAAIAYVQRRQGKWDDSIANLEAASQHDPVNLSYLDEQATTLSFLNRYDDARAVLDRALVTSPGDLGFIGKKVNTYLDEGNLPAADRLLNAQTAPPDDLGLLNSRITSMLFHRQFDGVYRLLKSFAEPHAKELGAQILDLYGTMGWAQRLGGDVTGAKATFTEAARLGERFRAAAPSAHVLNALAVIESGLDENTAALRDINQAVELVSNDAFQRIQMKYNQVQIEAAAGDADSAIAQLSLMINAPGGPTVRLLRLNPFLDPLRGDPRFQKLAAGT